MKNAIEQMFSFMIMIFILFLFTSFFYIEIRNIGARNAHSTVVERLQAEGNYSDAILNYYANKYEGFTFKKEGERVFVKYRYDMDVPFLGLIQNIEIIGYAR